MSKINGIYYRDSVGASSAYIYTGINFEPPAIRTIEVSEGVNIDVDAKGRVVGIDIWAPHIDLVKELRVV